jgi:hypothetical protein
LIPAFNVFSLLSPSLTTSQIDAPTFLAQDLFRYSCAAHHRNMTQNKAQIIVGNVSWLARIPGEYFRSSRLHHGHRSSWFDDCYNDDSCYSDSPPEFVSAKLEARCTALG